MSTPWAAALEGLAERRRLINEAIVSLAKVAGIDPAPYLDDTTAPSAVLPLADRLRDAALTIRDPQPPKEPAPPRPPAPASPTTNGAGHEDKVLQALKHGALPPKTIGELTKIPKHQLHPVMKRLILSKKIRRIGSGPRNTAYQLP